jgi:hypothetical protein
MGTVSRSWTNPAIAPQSESSSGWITIPDGTTRIDVDVQGNVGLNFKVEINYKTEGQQPAVVWTETNVVSDPKSRFVMGSSWDGPFPTGTQFQITGTNMHADTPCTQIQARVTYTEPDEW